MAELPILPVKTDALLADTTHMSPEEFGAYCRLLFVMWRHEARLHDDDSELATIVGLPLKRWKAIKEKVMRPMTVGGGFVSQKRLTDTWMNVQELRRKRASASNTRWKTKQHPNGMQMDIHDDSTSNAIKTKTRITSSFSVAPREEPQTSAPVGSLATALLESALREPSSDKSKEIPKLSAAALAAIGPKGYAQ